MSATKEKISIPEKLRNTVVSTSFVKNLFLLLSRSLIYVSRKLHTSNFLLNPPNMIP